MTGASNKIFDYMAAGLGVLITDLPEWRDLFVVPGYARACDPTDSGSIAAALGWFSKNSRDRFAMAAHARDQVRHHWNYDNSFAPVLRSLCDA
jgi:hypothetical protein